MFKFNGAKTVRKKPTQTVDQRFRQDQQEMNLGPQGPPTVHAARPATQRPTTPITNKPTSPAKTQGFAKGKTQGFGPQNNAQAMAVQRVLSGGGQMPTKGQAAAAAIDQPQAQPENRTAPPSHRNELFGGPGPAQLQGPASIYQPTVDANAVRGSGRETSNPQGEAIDRILGAAPRPVLDKSALEETGRQSDNPNKAAIDRILGGGGSKGWSADLPSIGTAGPVPTGASATPAPGVQPTGPVVPSPTMDDRLGAPAGPEHPGAPDDRNIAQRIEDWAAANIGAPRDIAAEEALIREQMAAQAGQGLVDQRARAGAMGFGDSGAMLSMENDLRQQNALAASDAILGNQRDARDEELNRTVAAGGLMRGERGLALEETKFDMLMQMLEELSSPDGSDAPEGESVLRDAGDVSSILYTSGDDDETYRSGPMNDGDEYTRSDPRFGGVTPVVASMLPPGSKPVEQRTDGTIFEGPDGARYWVAG